MCGWRQRRCGKPTRPGGVTAAEPRRRATVSVPAAAGRRSRSSRRAGAGSAGSRRGLRHGERGQRATNGDGEGEATHDNWCAVRGARELELQRRGRPLDVRGEGASSCSRSIRLPQPVECPRRSRLDGAAPHVEHGRGLLLGQVEQEAAREHLARVRRAAARARRAARHAARRQRQLQGLGRRGRAPRPPRPPRASQLLSPAG